MVSLMATWFSFNICTVHIYYGDEKNEQGIVERRKKEIETISSVLLERQKEEDVSYILLGDFNIPDTNGVYFNALSKKRGFFVPKEIQKHPTDLGQVSHYDQIAFKLKLEDEMVLYSDKEQRAGAFNFTESVYRDSDEVSDYDIYLKHYLDSYLGELDKENAKLKAKGKAEKEDTVEGRRAFFRGWRTYQMSDHLPLWVELKIDFSDQFLKNRAAETEEAKKAAMEEPNTSDAK
jgi:exonuclease III